MGKGALRAQGYYTPEEYLAYERASELKHEYVDGRIVAMAGASPAHSAIMVNLTGQVYAQLRGKGCQAFSNDTKVRSASKSLFSYPDLSVVCGEPRYHDEKGDVLLNPAAIFEILSSSTESFDRGEKFRYYQELESLKDYVLIAQAQARVEHFIREADNEWRLIIIGGLAGQVPIASIDCILTLSDLYERVTFPTKSKRGAKQKDSAPGKSNLIL